MIIPIAAGAQNVSAPGGLRQCPSMLVLSLLMAPLSEYLVLPSTVEVDGFNASHSALVNFQLFFSISYSSHPTLALLRYN